MVSGPVFSARITQETDVFCVPAGPSESCSISFKSKCLGAAENVFSGKWVQLDSVLVNFGTVFEPPDYILQHGQGRRRCVVKELCDANADEGASTQADMAAIHFASQKGHTEVVRTLLLAGEATRRWNGISVSTLGSGTRLCISRPRVRAKVSSTFGNGPSVCIFTRSQVKVSSTSQEADGWAESNGSSFLQMWERAKQRRADDSEGRKLLCPTVAAANAFLAPYPVPHPKISAPSGKAQTSSKPQSARKVVLVSVREVRPQLLEVPKGRTENGASAPVKRSTRGTPGPDFWSWVPDPLDTKSEPPLQSGSRDSGLAPQKAGN
ncbi:hypothetical protein R1sor_013862 [Riccia sorocarpa]|uniref:Uncharacterized protein n=1 Tax=Riccia sorocarpa TaxID=122646 RepID=A0ABD3H7Y1_9MARC